MTFLQNFAQSLKQCHNRNRFLRIFSLFRKAVLTIVDSKYDYIGLLLNSTLL